jgi:N-acetylmuramoyl-L-alanine amidase
VVVETTRPCAFHLLPCGHERIELVVEGGGVLATGVISVHDGLLEEIGIAAGPGGTTRLGLTLDHPAPCYLHEETGCPHRIVLDLDRASLGHLLSGRRVAVDPGHGGADTGFAGPVNLLEKDVALAIARDLGRLLAASGAEVVFLRRNDDAVPWLERAERARGAELYLGIHAGCGTGGSNVGYNPAQPQSAGLARLVREKLVDKTHLAAQEVCALGHLAVLGACPAVEIEAVTITDWVEEGLLRSPTFRSKVAQGIFNGLVSHLWRQQGGDWRGKPAAVVMGRRSGSRGSVGVIPLRTHLITERDDIFGIVERYVKGVAEPGDIVVLAESMVAITQGRAVLQESVHPGPLAAFLSRFPGKDGSLATPHAMQLAIEEAGAGRVVLGAAAAALGRPLGRRGDFYRVAGRHLALIDDVAGTMWPFEKHIILGPRDPAALASRLKERLGLEVVIVDVNDIRCVDILGASPGVDRRLVRRALASNPLGNDDQQTPVAILRMVNESTRRRGQAGP